MTDKTKDKLTDDTHLNFNSDNLSKALLTAAQIMGSTATSFGSGAGAVTSGLSGVIKT